MENRKWGVRIMEAKKYRRIFTIVVDSCGIGGAKDAERFGDAGTDTLGHIAETVGNLSIPNMQKLGIANLKELKNIAPVEKPMGYFTRLSEASNGKDTMTGHWEMMGLHITKPFLTFTEHGFPKELIDELEKRTGHKVIGNKSASGTEILEELGEEEIATGHMIVYTSADSVCQIAAHEEIIPVEQLYEYCKIAREMLTGDLGVGRVIARPFIGTWPNYERTIRRHDFSLAPPRQTVLDALKAEGKDVIGVGKIYDIFEGQGVTETYPNQGNEKNMEKTIEIQKKEFDGLCYVNLVDGDMIYGHRRDIAGYAGALTRFDEQLGEFLANMRDDDMLMITADHGCDPGYTGTDHTREYVPCLIYGKEIKAGVNLHTRKGFADMAATIAEALGSKYRGDGESFWDEIRN